MPQILLISHAFISVILYHNPTMFLRWLLLVLLVYFEATANAQNPESISETNSITPSKNWPNPNIKYGQVSAVTIDNSGNVVVFHRGSHVWNLDSFSRNFTYMKIEEGPIEEDTILIINNDSGYLMDTWGKNSFYMPHGLTIDSEGNTWLTDVALHQVLKYSPQRKLSMSLGVKFEPGTGEDNFCQPTSVAILPENGDFYVADGYCNSRLVKYSKDGTRLMQIGTEGVRNAMHFAPYDLYIPHALAVLEDREQVCVADREHGRVLCYNYLNGTVVTEYKHSREIGSRLFSLAYTPLGGGKFFVVNGVDLYGAGTPVRGFMIDIRERKIEVIFAPENGQFSFPHDIAVSKHGDYVYVADLNPAKLFKFQVNYLYGNYSIGLQAQPFIKRNSSGTGLYLILSIVVAFCAAAFVCLLFWKLRRNRNNRYDDQEGLSVFFSK